jgi:hypothetical protein
MPSRKEIRKKKLAMTKPETANPFSLYHSHLVNAIKKKKGRKTESDEKDRKMLAFLGCRKSTLQDLRHDATLLYFFFF